MLGFKGKIIQPGDVQKIFTSFGDVTKTFFAELHNPYLTQLHGQSVKYGQFDQHKTGHGDGPQVWSCNWGKG